MGAANAVDATVSLDQADGVPGEVVIDDDAAVLEVLTLGQDVGADQDVDLLVAVRDRYFVRNRGEQAQHVRPLARVVAAVDVID